VPVRPQREEETVKVLKQVCHAALRVPDIEASVRHATEVLGLREVERVDGCVYLTCGPKHHDLQLIASDRVAIDHIGLEARGPKALEQIARRLADEGVEILAHEADEPGVGDALRFVAPGGHCFEIHAGMARDQPASWNGPGARPRKFGHVTIAAPDRGELEGFLERVLGFIPSDRLGEDAVWMRCNADHHGIAVARGDAGLRHVAWEIESWGQLEVAADHLCANGIALTWGPGRHGPGNNLAHYHRDPAGATHEYLADLERIEDDTWRGRDWAGVPNWRNLWGWDPTPALLDGDFPPIVQR
jgi:catechol 2,3-dioxygenase